jgi:hypothetical protein
MLVGSLAATAREAVIASHCGSAIVAFEGQDDDLQAARKDLIDRIKNRSVFNSPLGGLVLWAKFDTQQRSWPLRTEGPQLVHPHFY